MDGSAKALAFGKVTPSILACDECQIIGCSDRSSGGGTRLTPASSSRESEWWWPLCPHLPAKPLVRSPFATRGRAFNCCGPIGVFGSAELLCLIEPQTGKAMAPERTANSATMSSAAKSATAELLVPAVVDHPPSKGVQPWIGTVFKVVGSSLKARSKRRGAS